MIFPFYSLIDIVSALLFAFYFVNSLKLTTQKPSLDKIHRFLLLLTTLFFCVDAIWGFYDSGIFTSTRGFFITTTFLFIIMSFITFSWVLYAIVYLENVKRKLFFINVGFFILLILLSFVVSNFFSKNIFYITKDCSYRTGKMRPVLYFFEYIPFLLIFFLCLYHSIKEIHRHLWKYIVVLFFVLMPFFCGILQEVFPSAPFLSIGYLTSISVIHIFVIAQKHDKLIQNQNDELQNVMISITSTFEIIATLNLDTGEEKVIRSCGIMKRGSFSDRNSISYENRVFAFLHDIVYKEDRENVYNELKTDVIWDKVKYGIPHRIHFRVKENNNLYWYEIRITLLMTKKKSRSVAFIIRDITSDVVKEKEFTNELIESKKKMQEQLNILNSLAGIYMTMHLIDLKDNKIHSYSSKPHIDKLLNEVSGADKQMHHVMKNVVTKKSLDEIFEFIDLHTLSSRMKEQKVISKEFIGKNFGWCKAQFIEISCDSDGNLTQVMFTTQIIDKEKRREEDMIMMTKTDELTKILNRRCYDEELKKLEFEIPEKLVVISADVNNLKHVNDTKGHAAGDELICAAATILTETFKEYGNVFRTGGDEFVAFIQTDDIQLLEQQVSVRIKEWKGEAIASIQISIGYASKKENPSMNIHQLCKLADSQMYKEKAEFYKNSGIERRRRNNS